MAMFVCLMNCTYQSFSIKAVANGSLSFYLDLFVSSRMAMVSYCVKSSPSYNPLDSEHKKRHERGEWYTLPSGRTYIKGGLGTIVTKVNDILWTSPVGISK